MDDVLDKVGRGPALATALLAAGGESVACGAMKGLVPLLTTAVGLEFALSGYQKGWLYSAIFAGNFAGNAASGVLVDLIGRRQPLLMAFVIMLTASSASTLASGYWTLLLARSVLGFGLGVGGCAINCIAGEVSATHLRLTSFAVCMTMFSIGMIIAIALVWWADPALTGLVNWRELTFLCNLPVVLCFGLCLVLVDESPRYLARRGRDDEAHVVLTRMAQRNGSRVDHWVAEQPPSAGEGFSALGRRALRPVLAAVCVSCFVLNFVYYGTLYSLPQMLPDLQLGLTPALSLLVGTFVELPGLWLGVWLGENHFSRKHCVLFYLAGTALSLLAFWVAAELVPAAGERLSSESHLPVVLATLGLFGVRFFTSIGWLVVYLYMAEVFPTSCRGSGCAIGMSLGRAGSIVAPLLYETLFDAAGHYHAYFATTIALLAVNAGFVTALELETKGKQLGDIEAETAPLQPGKAS